MDYLTQVCFGLNVTEEQYTSLKKKLDRYEEDWAKETNPDGNKLDEEYEDFLQGIVQYTVEFNAGTVYFTNDESANTEALAKFVQEFLIEFDIKEPVEIDAAHTGSRPVPDAYGGHSVYVDQEDIKFCCPITFIDLFKTKKLTKPEGVSQENFEFLEKIAENMHGQIPLGVLQNAMDKVAAEDAAVEDNEKQLNRYVFSTTDVENEFYE
jgi:hypothetical protein